MKSIYLIFTSICIITLTSCGFDCIDRKTGVPRSSQSLEQSKENEVYQFQMNTNRPFIKVDTERKLLIKNAWIENSWLYDCVDSRAVIKKEPRLQFVIDGEYVHPENDTERYTLALDGSNSSVLLGGQLRFNYSGQDTLKMTVYNNRMKKIDTVIFWKTS